MEGCASKDGSCPQLLNLMVGEREWEAERGEQIRHGPSSEEKKLELRLGLPGEEWTTQNNGCGRREKTILSPGYPSANPMASSFTHNSTKTFLENHGWISSNGGQTQKFPFSENQGGTGLASPWLSSSFQVNPPSLAVVGKESLPHCNSKAVELQGIEKKAFPPAPANTAVPNSTGKRSAPAPAVGWPPIRSFRKNLASSSSAKPISKVQNAVPGKLLDEKQVEICPKGFFVKINMDGVPIGRKVDLKAYDSYQKLSSVVDELFRGLLPAQGDSPACGMENDQEEKKEITGLLDGSGEYTLVYEDNEGDRMLVGDVPWHMFVSTVKRLRVLKSSELSRVCFGSRQGKRSLDAVPR